MKSLKIKSSGRKWSREEIVRYCQRYVAKVETHATKGIAKAIEKHIKKSDKAPLGWNEAYRTAKLRASGIKGAVKEKAKKGKFLAGGWWLVLVIVVPILVVVYLILNRDIDLPPEGGFTDDDFKP